MVQYLKVSIICTNEDQDLLIAELGELGFDSFQQFDSGLDAFIEEELFDKTELCEILKRYGLQSRYQLSKLENANWNEVWERNFKPVYIEDQVQIRASFHIKKEAFKHDIIIDPKMSFGTGHHETTYLMIAEQLKTDHRKKNILDVGAGTGILSVMAFQLGAKTIVSTDIDDWCIKNCQENFELNRLTNFNILQGKIENLTLDGVFDIILANIKKNVLLEELTTYASLLTKSGKIILSGFYAHDIAELVEKGQECKLECIGSDQKNDWARISFSKLST